LSNNTFFRFILVGVINTLVGGAFIFLLYNVVEIGYWWSSAVSYVLISILSFFLNKYFTFGVRHWSVFMVFSFILTIIISYLIAYCIAKPAMNYLLRGNSQKIRENTALFTGMCLFTGLNYLGQRLIVFKSKGKKQ
jgi:putative flippase GtrA